MSYKMITFIEQGVCGDRNSIDFLSIRYIVRVKQFVMLQLIYKDSLRYLGVG